MRSKRALWIALGYVPAMIAGAGGLYALLGFALRWALALMGLPASAQGLAAVGLANLLSPLLAAAVTQLYLRVTDGSTLRDLGLGWGRRAFLLLTIGTAVSMTAVALTIAVSLWSGKLAVYGWAHPTLWALLASLGLAARAGWVEELVCRGVILQKVEAGFNRPAALVISSAVFVLPHFSLTSAAVEMSWVRLITLILISLTLTYVYYFSSRQLWLPIGLHWGLDLMTFLLIGSHGQRLGALLNWWVVGPWTAAGVRFFDWLPLGALAGIWIFLGGWRLMRAARHSPLRTDG